MFWKGGKEGGEKENDDKKNWGLEKKVFEEKGK